MMLGQAQTAGAVTGIELDRPGRAPEVGAAC